MNFLKSLYRKLFGIKTGSYDSWDEMSLYLDKVRADIEHREGKKYFATYDPSQDENKIMNGEVESYFE